MRKKEINYLYVGWSILTPFQVKIGITNNLEHRLDTFHTVDHYMQFIGVKRYHSREAVFKNETKLHRYFDYLHSERGKEWFHLNKELFMWLLAQGFVPNLIAEFIKQLFHRLGVKIWQVT